MITLASVRALALLAVLTAPLVVDGLPLNQCSGAFSVFDPSSFTCTACPGNATGVDGVCICDVGYAASRDARSGRLFCDDCAGRGMAVMSGTLSRNGSQYCIPCGGDTQLPCLLSARYDPATRQCTCPAGSALTERVGPLVLTALMCAPCPNGECGASTCTFPYAPAAAAGTTPGEVAACTCVSGFTLLYDGSCVPTEQYESMAAVIQPIMTTSVSLLNEDNSGTTRGTPVPVAFVQSDAVGAAVLCLLGNMTACNYLANMCVVMQYNAQSVPCALYLHLKRTKGCADTSCERPADLPWIYYVRGTADALTDSTTTFQAAAQAKLQFVVSTYDLKGNWKGYWPANELLNLCRLPNTAFAKFFQAGDIRRTECRPLWSWYAVAEETDFYELFLVNPRDNSDLIPIPVTVDYASRSFQTISALGSWTDRPSGNYMDGTPASNGLRRRFYVYDNVGGRRAGSASAMATRLPSYLASLWSISVVLSNIESDAHVLRTPLAVLQYATKDTAGLQVSFSGNYTSVKSPHGAPLADIGTSGSFSARVETYFLSDRESVRRGLMITLIVMSSLCFVSAWLSTYGWMRRRQNHILDLSAFLRFFVYLCNHISNTYLLVVALTSWFLLVSYKSQQWLDVPLRTEERYLDAMLYTAVVTKGVAVLYGLLEQCNADYFVVDWERSKGQLLRENKIVPVSMWRSTFLANELNELQGLRYWHPLITMSIVVLFLVGLRYENLTLSVPHGSRNVDATAVSAKTLRMAVDTFFWLAVALVIYLLEFQIFYRFVVVHPLEAFVDLCSVSNISVIIMPEPQFGYYIHGESIHAHSDVSMEEFQNNLFLESQGNLPVRGLGGQSKCQTFEVYLGPYTRQYLNVCYIEMALEDVKSGGRPAKPVNPMTWHVADCLKGLSRKPRVFSQATLAIKDRINNAFQQSVRRAEGALLVKFVLQKWFGFPPNVMYMNGPHNNEKGGRDLFFVDDVLSYGRAFMCGLDLDLVLLYTALFAAIDSSLSNVYASVVLTYVVELVFSWYRRNEGVANMSKKTLIDSRFFL